MDPQDKINDVYNEINSFFMVYSEAPIFGVDFSLGRQFVNYFNNILLLFHQS